MRVQSFQQLPKKLFETFCCLLSHDLLIDFAPVPLLTPLFPLVTLHSDTKSIPCAKRLSTCSPNVSPLGSVHFSPEYGAKTGCIGIRRKIKAYSFDRIDRSSQF